jgi:hypothetical protein
LVDLGATPEQLDRSRARARDELEEAAADASERTSVPTSSHA